MKGKPERPVLDRRVSAEQIKKNTEVWKRWRQQAMRNL